MVLLKFGINNFGGQEIAHSICILIFYGLSL